MRILAALTLLISVLISGPLSGAPPELQWEYEVNPNQFLPTSSVTAWSYAPQLNSQGGCVARVELAMPAPSSESSFVIFTLDPDGSLQWKSPPYASQPRLVLFKDDSLVFRFSSTAPDRNGNTRYFYVPLNTQNENETPILLPSSQSGLISHVNPLPENAGDGSFLKFTRVESDKGYCIQKWTFPSPTPDLAPSTFGLEDGNLIISWPTAAGQTYQVQRSTDLESWEDIGVALTGNGTTMSYAQPSTAEKVFLRVVVP